ncbi:Shedu anti-phage system protein SduA domain-containing protein [Pseudomonas viridiflava]|uniref:Shedu anti-phage system protein SduA domain-containing protein n=1 Tax=Pseudomonas viridiflava TaxID=33069 RepID=UPI002EB07B8F|nr:Shedu anti-phage system protein SduA domain-containing protein [Pseudomonas viridiflava]
MQEMEAHYVDGWLATDARVSLSENELPSGTEPMLRQVLQGTLSKIVDGEQRTPNVDEIVSWVRNTYRENPLIGDIARAMFVINEDLVVADTELPTPDEVLRDLQRLEKLKLDRQFFVSSTFNGRPSGVLFRRSEMEAGGVLFEITVFGREGLAGTVGQLNLQLSSTLPEPFLSMCTGEGWIRFDREYAVQQPQFMFLLQCLYQYKKYIYPVVPVNSLIDDRKDRPRDNPYLVKLIARSYRNQVTCTRVQIDLSLIHPRDIDYALRIPDEDISRFISHARTTDILLYEDNGALVMDDDYLVYMACRALGLTRVNAVIVGAFDQPLAEILEVGGRELIPPVGITRHDIRSRRGSVDKDHLLQRKVSALRPKPSQSAMLERNFIELCRLLGRVSTREKDLHRFLKQHTQVLDCHVAAVYSEVRIGKYRADLVLQYRQSDKRVVLVELEPHSDQIFTKRNSQRCKVTHAVQQVRDWMREIHNNATNLPHWLSGNYTAEGMVVIGRSKDLTQEQKNTLMANNATSDIKILTYDDLLERFQRLIETLDKQ